MQRYEYYEISSPGLRSTSSNPFKNDTVALISLQKENQELRKRLKDLNIKLTDAITQKESKKRRPSPTKVAEDGHQKAESKLESYINEKRLLHQRIDKLSDPNYECSLKDKIQRLQNVLISKQNAHKLLNATLSIKETAARGNEEASPSDYANYLAAISLYTQRIKKLDETERLNMQGLQEWSQKYQELNQNYLELKNIVGDAEISMKREQDLKERIKEREWQLKVKEKEFNANFRDLNQRIKELELESSEIQREENFTKLEIARKSEALDDINKEFKRNRIGGLSPIVSKKGRLNGNISFITNHEYSPRIGTDSSFIYNLSKPNPYYSKTPLPF
ncbi:unnamed protein product [Blepharisma stoltei]|uniref:Uncharacterized protein n=1 Tax=Blepharisma stoltei TaxID=1481888 RepID=A0AAU9IKE5_9CILI|nr:unnamed protein product [Blepharisma stoltei]